MLRLPGRDSIKSVPLGFAFELSKGGLINEPEWPTIQNAMIDSIDRLAKAMKPPLREAEDYAVPSRRPR